MADVTSLRRSCPLVSVCIPTYNGADTLAQTLDSILSQERDGLEVIVCDDCSGDATLAVAQAYAGRYRCLKVVDNDTNVGMDRNFARAALRCTGEFIWFCGQDDILEPGAIDKCWEVLTGDREVDFVYFNYRAKNGNLTKVVTESFLPLQEDRYYVLPEEYFRDLDYVCHFLPATVMRRAFWETTPYEQFFDTHYVQVGVWLYNFVGHRAYVVADPSYVTGRAPEGSWKYHGGQMLFEIFSGHLDVYHRMFHSPRNPIPRRVYEKAMREFLWNLPHYTFFYSEKGFRCTPVIEERMKRLFGGNPWLYWLYVWPQVHLPEWMYGLCRGVYRFAGTGWLVRAVRRLVARMARSARV